MLIHHNVKLLDVIIRILPKVFVDVFLVKSLLLRAVSVPEETHSAQETQIADHLRIVKGHVIFG